jgi:predicted methyltransferase
MHDNKNGKLGLILGGIIAVAAVIFLLTGGDLGGKKVVNGDDDLPPVATQAQR